MKSTKDNKPTTPTEGLKLLIDGKIIDQIIERTKKLQIHKQNTNI